MNLTLGDIGDLFKMAHEQQTEINRLREQVKELDEKLREREEDAPNLDGARSRDGGN